MSGHCKCGHTTKSQEGTEEKEVVKVWGKRGRTEEREREGEIKWQTLKCSSSLHCRRLAPGWREDAGKQRAVQRAGAAPEGSEEPACTKLMGNRSEWLLPSLEQGLEGERRVEVHEMGGSTEKTKSPQSKRRGRGGGQKMKNKEKENDVEWHNRRHKQWHKNWESVSAESVPG